MEPGRTERRAAAKRPVAGKQEEVHKKRIMYVCLQGEKLWRCYLSIFYLSFKMDWIEILFIPGDFGFGVGNWISSRSQYQGSENRYCFGFYLFVYLEDWDLEVMNGGE